MSEKEIEEKSWLNEMMSSTGVVDLNVYQMNDDSWHCQIIVPKVGEIAPKKFSYKSVRASGDSFTSAIANACAKAKAKERA